MVQIYFNDEYPKLWGQEFGELIFIKVVNKSQLSKNLIEYDTKKSNDNYYDLPDGELIQLFFIGNHGIPFCTLRKYSKDKHEYYKGLIGKVFDLVVEDGR
jgi:hypothetical protein